MDVAEKKESFPNAVMPSRRWNPSQKNFDVVCVLLMWPDG